MAITRHDFPILEFDTEAKAILMPDRKRLYDLPEKCVFAFLGDYVEQHAATLKSAKVAEFDTVTKLFHVYQTEYEGQEICFCHAPLGAAASVQYLDFLIAYGVRQVVACGCCGTLRDIPENQILIPVSALRDEGTSYHYLPPSREIAINTAAVRAIKAAADHFGIPHQECKTWTTDGFYRETRDMVDYRRQEGCEVVEMECSALAACAEFRAAVFGQILFTGDTLVSPTGHDDRGWGEASWETALKLAFEAVHRI